MKKIEEALDFLNIFIGHNNYVAGNDFTLADIALVTTVRTIQVKCFKSCQRLFTSGSTRETDYLHRWKFINFVHRPQISTSSNIRISFHGWNEWKRRYHFTRKLTPKEVYFSVSSSKKLWRDWSSHKPPNFTLPSWTIFFPNISTLQFKIISELDSLHRWYMCTESSSLSHLLCSY